MICGGSQSKAATKKFQIAYGLDADGIFGTDTMNKTLVVIKGIQEVIGTVADGLAGPLTRANIKEVLIESYNSK